MLMFLGHGFLNPNRSLFWEHQHVLFPFEIILATAHSKSPHSPLRYIYTRLGGRLGHLRKDIADNSIWQMANGNWPMRIGKKGE